MKTFRLVLGILFLVPVLISAVPARAQSCQDFAERQIRLSQQQVERGNFSSALRVLDVALQNGCDIAIVRGQIARVLEAWYESARDSGSNRQMREVIQQVSSRSALDNDARAELQQRIRSTIESRIVSAYEGSNYRRAYQLCRTYDAYSERTFTLNYACGRSAREVNAVGAATARYERLMDNWTTNQSLVTREDLTAELKQLYLTTGQFDQAYVLSKQLAQRTPTPGTLIATLTAARGQALAPIVRVAQAFYDSNPSSTAGEHVRSEMESIKFPSYVQASYLLADDGTATTTFVGSNAAVLPETSLLEQSSGSVSLHFSASDSTRTWLVGRTDPGWFVVQFGQQTTAEENVILEGLLQNSSAEDRWASLYEQVFTTTYPATGSAVATFMGGTYLADAAVESYESVFESMPVLNYFCVQDQSGGIVASYSFSRSEIQYEDRVWNRTSQTPALYHHTVQRGDQSLREVVWPTYQGNTWSGVVRVGMSTP